MEHSYSAKSSNLRPYELSAGDHRGIGRLIRACAEIEDIIDLYLGNLAQLGEGQSIVLLGRTSAAQKLKMAESFAISKGDDALALHNEAFNQEAYRLIVKCRNTVAHGVLLGMTEDDEIAFQVKEPMGFADDSKLYLTVNAYRKGAFLALAKVAEGVIPQLEDHLGVQSLRDRRRARVLGPHLKADPQARRRAKPGSQTQSSQALARAAKKARKDAQREQAKKK